MLTEKGRFVLDCLKQGINVSRKRYDELWENSRRLTDKTVYRICGACGQKIEDLEEK